MQQQRGNSIPYRYFASAERPCLAERVEFDLYATNRLAPSNGTDRVPSSRLSRIIQVSFAFLIAFLLLMTVSFLAIRPTLNSVRMEAKADWDSFVRAVAERNNLIPSVVESFRSFELGQAKLAGSLMESRAMCMRSPEPDRMVAAVDETDRLLEELSKLAQSKPALDQYAPFTTQWRKVYKISHRIGLLRAQYNSSAGMYNQLLNVFPQNLLATAFGFAPLNDYPAPLGAVEASQ